MEQEVSEFWAGKRVIVTGGAGFLGWPLCRKLWAAGAEVFVPRRRDYDLRVSASVYQMFRDFPKPDMVYHLAATVGGIGFSRAHPAHQIYDGLQMGLNVVGGCALRCVPKLVFVGSVCAYPKFTPVPFKESSLWDGYPEETNAAYGISKRAIIALIQAYRQEYGFNGVCLLPTNMYGPRDNFDPVTSHVIPALISKAITAKENGDTELTVWGTGMASRDFLYVHDAVEALLLAGERLETSEPVNIGSGSEVSIADLVVTIASLVGYEGPIIWDASKPDGQPRRCLDVSRAKELLGWGAKTPLLQGLKETIEWYKGQCRE